jgi:hypothetical protein
MLFNFYLYKAGKIKNQLIYSIITFYGIILIILLLLPNQIISYPGTPMNPEWTLGLTIFIFMAITIGALIPSQIFSIILWRRFKTGESRKRWLKFMIGQFGMISVYLLELYGFSQGAYPGMINTIVSLYLLPGSIIWGYFLYQGIGRKIGY